MLVSQVVNKDVPTVRPQDDVLTAARRLLECHCGVVFADVVRAIAW